MRVRWIRIYDFRLSASVSPKRCKLRQRLLLITSLIGEEPQKNCCIFQLNMSMYDRLTDLIHMMTSETAILIDFG